MDRSNSLTSNFRTLRSHTPLEQLAPRLTSRISDSKAIIRIPNRNVPDIKEGQSQTRNYQWMNLVSPNMSKQSPISPVTVLPLSPKPILHQVLEGIAGSKVTKSNTSFSTTHDWEAECRQLKKVIQNQRTKPLQSDAGEAKDKKQQSCLCTTRQVGCALQIDYKHKLEETEQRMGEQNAYLRDCMLKLHQQLDMARQEKKADLEMQMDVLREENRNITEEVLFRNQQLTESETNYNRLVDILEEQKQLGIQVDARLAQLQGKVVFLQSQNGHLVQQLTRIGKSNDALAERLEQEKDRNRHLLSENADIRKSFESQREIAQQLKLNVGKLRSQSNGRVDQPTKQKSTPKIELGNYNLTGGQNQRRSLSKMQAVKYIPIQQHLQFQICEYTGKSQEFKDLKSNIQPHLYHQQILRLVQIAEYFNSSLDRLLSQRLNSQQLMQKYKRLVEIVVKNPKSDGKSSEFVNDLIQKCNLLQSSAQEKKASISSLQEQITALKKQRNTDNRSRRTNSPQDSMSKQNLSRNIAAQTLIVPKPVPSNQRENSHLKLKNLSGQDILKQMENKLKFYEGEMVPGLQAQINEYKGMINDYQNSIHTQSTSELRHSESFNLQELGIESCRSNRMASHSFDRRKQRLGFGCNQGLQNSSNQKPGTAESLSAYNPRKKRLDQITRGQLNNDVLIILIFKLCEIAQTMANNSNFVTIVPDSVYIINYSEESLRQAKLKVLETPKFKIEAIKKYWAPQNLKGGPFSQASLVWNIGLILDDIVHCKGHLQGSSHQESPQLTHPLFRKLLQGMLEPEVHKRARLSTVQEIILSEGRNVLN